MLSYYYYFLGELLGERNYIIIIFLEYDNSATSYRTVYFLSLKSTDAMLGAFKDFYC